MDYQYSEPETMPPTPPDFSGPESDAETTPTDISAPSTPFHKDSFDGLSFSLPNLFTGIMGTGVVVNPNYEKAKAAAAVWARDIFRLDEKGIKRNAKADLAFAASVALPDADEERLLVALMWAYWFFAFDDRIDEGDLQNDPIRSAAEIIETLAMFEEGCSPVTAKRNPVGYMFQKAWLDMKATSSEEWQARYKSSHRKYFKALVKQVHYTTAGTLNTISFDEYMDIRRGNACTWPFFSISEWAFNIDLPQHIMEHPSISTCKDVLTDMIIYQNEVMSLRKDLAYGVDCNLIFKLMKEGYSTQDAIDKIGNLLDDCYERWDKAVSELPSWDIETDRQVLRLLDAYRLFALGTLEWSFKCGRYFGEDGDEVRKTWVFKLKEVNLALHEASWALNQL
ncbi:hypothetical protein ABW19_dt0201791 [Dactylella cylindrospora]|nr:hypothetical protein ABW19_dt0201791 [Dactylella cylindrospora]